VDFQDVSVWEHSIGQETSPGLREGMVNTQVTQNEDDKIAIDFIDPLFAVVLHMSFVQMKEEPWFSNFRLTYHDPYYFRL